MNDLLDIFVEDVTLVAILRLSLRRAVAGIKLCRREMPLRHNGAVRKHWGKLVGAAVAVFGVVVILLLRPPSEPVFQGRTVTEWLDRMRYCSAEGFQGGEPQTDPALVALRQMGAPAVPVCYRYLSTARELPLTHRIWMQAQTFANHGTRPPDPMVSRWTCAAAALIYLGPGQGGGASKVIDAVLEAPIARPAAANGFYLIGTNEPSVLPALVAGLGDSRVPVRHFCAEAIAAIAPWAGPAWPTLTNLINDPDLTVRNYAIGTLGEIGKGNPGVVGLLQTAIVSTTNRDVIATAVRALGQLGPTKLVADPPPGIKAGPVRN